MAGSSRDGWVDEGVEFGISLYGMCLSMNCDMLPFPTPTLHRSKYLFHHGPPEDMKHEIYKQLYPNIIRDIDVSSYM